MLYRSYELGPLFLKKFENTCSICQMWDFTKVCGFVRFVSPPNDVNGTKDFFDIKKLLETRYGRTLFRHSYDDLPDIMQHVTDKVIHYRNGVRFVVAVVMN
jgi:hypothetical protein